MFREKCCIDGCDNVRTIKHTRPDGRKVYRKKCVKHHLSPAKTARVKQKSRKRVTLKRHPHTAFKKGECELCGFIPVNRCQLDVDHIDGNHANDDPSNLQTLCANCHRLKTFLNKDWEKSDEAEGEQHQLTLLAFP